MNEIKQKLEEWEWTNNNYKDSNINSKKEKERKDIPDELYNNKDNKGFNPQKNQLSEQKKSSKQIANLIWESVDEYFSSYIKISKLLNKLCNIKIHNEVNDLIDEFNNYLKIQEKNVMSTKILSDKIYTPFIYNRYNLENCLENSKQLSDLLRIYNRLEYIYYLFGAFEYSDAVNESDYLLNHLNIY